MTMPRKDLVDVNVTRYYHCISRCVRRAMLCGQGYEHRKQWIEQRLELLADSFALSVCGFAAMDNHLHVLVRLDPDQFGAWSAEEVVRRWMAVYPPKRSIWTIRRPSASGSAPPPRMPGRSIAGARGWGTWAGS